MTSQKDSSADPLSMEDSRYEQPGAGPVPSKRQGTRIAVRLVDTPVPCAIVRDDVWDAVRGATVVLGDIIEPSVVSAGNVCGTDVAWVVPRIPQNSRFYEALESNDAWFKGKTCALCRHQIEAGD